MRNFKLFILFVFASNVAFAQSKDLTKDSVLAIGFALDDCFISKEISKYCTTGYEKWVERADALVICGVTKCSNSFGDKYFYEIASDNNVYYAEKNKIMCDSTYFRQLESMSPEQKEKFRAFSQSVALSVYIGELEKALDFLKKCKTKGIAVLDWSYYDESEYTSGTGVRVSVHNPTSKTIKYIWFNIVGYNPVGDKVIDPKKKTSTITLKGVGPIDADKSSTYEFSYAWFSDLVETAKIVSVKVQYMDNTFKTISGTSGIIMPKNLYELLSEN